MKKLLSILTVAAIICALSFAQAITMEPKSGGMKSDKAMKDDGMKKDDKMKDDGMKKDKGMKQDDGMKKKM